MTTALKYAVEPAGMARLTVDILDQVSFLSKNELELAASTDAHGTVSGRFFGLSIWHHGYKEVREEQEYFMSGSTSDGDSTPAVHGICSCWLLLILTNKLGVQAHTVAQERPR